MSDKKIDTSWKDAFPELIEYKRKSGKMFVIETDAKDIEDGDYNSIMDVELADDFDRVIDSIKYCINGYNRSPNIKIERASRDNEDDILVTFFIIPDNHYNCITWRIYNPGALRERMMKMLESLK